MTPSLLLLFILSSFFLIFFYYHYILGVWSFLGFLKVFQTYVTRNEKREMKWQTTMGQETKFGNFTFKKQREKKNKKNMKNIKVSIHHKHSRILRFFVSQIVQALWQMLKVGVVTLFPTQSVLSPSNMPWGLVLMEMRWNTSWEPTYLGDTIE